MQRVTWPSPPWLHTPFLDDPATPFWKCILQIYTHMHIQGHVTRVLVAELFKIIKMAINSGQVQYSMAYPYNEILCSC